MSYKTVVNSCALALKCCQTTANTTGELCKFLTSFMNNLKTQLGDICESNTQTCSGQKVNKTKHAGNKDRSMALIC